jgi:uncharacterized membrane protein
MLLISGIIAFIIVVFFSLSGTENLSSINKKDWFYLVTGSLFVLVIGYILYIAGLSASNVTTMAYTALAYPALALLIEIMLGKIKVSNLTIQEIAGFFFLVVGYIFLGSCCVPGCFGCKTFFKSL